MNKLNIPIECNLPDAEIGNRLVNWISVREQMSSIVQVENGISARVPEAAAHAVREIAAAEAECCPSMLFEMTESGEEFGFRITSEKIDMVQAIHSLFFVGGR